MSKSWWIGCGIAATVWAGGVAMGDPESGATPSAPPSAPGSAGSSAGSPTGKATESQTPSRPGRSTPGPGNVPAVVPANETTTEPGDDDFLKETAGDLGVQPASARFDRQFLNWYGVRPALADKGLTFDISLTADESKNLQGGADTNNDVFRYLFDFRFNYDTSAGFGWKGGTFSVDFQNQSGRNGSDLYGDAQGFDNADSDGRTQISELWYEQIFGGDKFRVKVGKVDANSEFAAPEYGNQFLNSSFGYSPTITALPTYPDPAVSANLFFYPVPWFYCGYGIYDGGDGEPTGNHPPHTIYRGETDFFQIAEAGVRWAFAEQTLPGRFAVGVSYFNGHIGQFRGGEQNGTESIYAILEQKLFHYNYYNKTDERGVYAFAQFGSADEEVNDFRQHVGGGVTWVGPYQARFLDTLGVGFTTVFFSGATGSPYTEDSETSVEAFYNYQATSYISVKPDLQYIVHPGGDEDLRDALVASLRVTVAL